MAGGIVIAGIVILAMLAVMELVYIFAVPNAVQKDDDMFTVLVYRPEDTEFESYLKLYLRQRYWLESETFGKIFIVHTGVSEEQSEKVRSFCRKRQDVVYCSSEEFMDIITGDKNYQENGCNLS